MENKVLTDLLVNAKAHSYAVINEIPKTVMNDGGTELTYTEDQFLYRDRYYGGEPFIGEEVVIHNNIVIWGMNLRGKVLEPATMPVEDIYSFLREALKKMPADAPFRGPACFESNNLKYSSKVSGSVEQFIGVEKIFLGGKLIYEGFYHGGYVGQKGL